MMQMDFGIPDLTTGRDTAPDATRRRGKAEPSSGFAALLDRAVEGLDDQVRAQEPDSRPTDPTGIEQPRETMDRAERADRAHRHDHGRPETLSEDTAPASQAAAPAQQPGNDRPQEQATDGSATPQPGAQSPESPTDQVASPAPSDGTIIAAPTTVTPEMPADAGALLKPTKPGDVAAPAAPPAQPTTPLPLPTQTAEPVTPTPAQPAPTEAPAALPASFEEQLAAAAIKAGDTAPAKPATPEAIETTKPQAPTDVVTLAAVPPPSTATSGQTHQGAAQNNLPQAAPAPTPPQAPIAAPAPASTEPVTPATPVEDSGSGDAALLAVLRATNAQQQAAARTAEGKPAETPAPIDPMLKGIEIEVKPAAAPAKAETAAKPFGALAPGLGVAAQITSQQTPEQAAAASRLAEIATAAAADELIEELPAKTEFHKAVDAAASPKSHEPTAQVAELPSHRQTVSDASAINAAARAARPSFHPVITQVAAQMVQAAADGTDRISIRLSPAELGRIDVKLDFGPDGRVQAVFAAERPQTMELLQRDARDLERALQDAGLRADSGSLSFNLRGEARDGQGEQTPNGGRDRAPIELAAAQLQAYAAGNGGSGRLDIRI